MKQITLHGESLQISASECWYVMDEARREKTYTPSKDQINHDIGVYIFWGWNDKPIRIGKAVKTRNRVLAYGNSIYGSLPEVIDNSQYVSYIRCENKSISARLEVDLIREYKPVYNDHLYK